MTQRLTPDPVMYSSPRGEGKDSALFSQDSAEVPV